ncbi:hypothetical protein [Brevibacillus laterosporus]|uniref:hypothetical protein n=1 Tax=Brevibacillus laterosporus TaxID=1465 RepID=UPI0018CEBD35|nr:hypothetical protein [Brevibacillus laterosporus]MBG9775536.1 hypothetical protein [Brevibacillus laterosporus]MBG9798555.1 hypothetical protein [Brevibacillus laterosporus]MED1909854.1 hypothetical protein [Brevibacillus laterosporus]
MQDDHELIEQVLQGDKEAYTQITLRITGFNFLGRGITHKTVRLGLHFTPLTIFLYLHPIRCIEKLLMKV